VPADGVSSEFTQKCVPPARTQLAQLHGIGPNAIRTLRAALAEKGLSFRQD